MRHAITIVLALMILTPIAAGDELRHPAARKALIRAEQETRKAEQVYRQALCIQRSLISELEQAKSDAMQRQLLDEANAIQAAIDAARAELDRLEGKPSVQAFEIDATKPWQPTIEVRKGQKVEIRRGERGTVQSRWVLGRLAGRTA